MVILPSFPAQLARLQVHGHTQIIETKAMKHPSWFIHVDVFNVRLVFVYNDE